ncbi:MAG: hypothetical protein M1822_009952 [Bathelium mastoideum]|nr:MAG: hypothetical protein M1822_009952 [Bathelium mastoideum]
MARMLFLYTFVISFVVTVLGTNKNPAHSQPATQPALSANGTSPAVNQTSQSSNVTYDHTYKHFDCGTDSSSASDHFIHTVSTLNNKNGPKGAPGARKRSELPKRGFAITVDTYFHVVTETASAGTVTQDMANAQVSALNSAYQPVGVQFNLKGTDFTVNDAWAVGIGQDDTNMKTALRNGTYDALNIYFQTNLNGSILGTCSLPTNITGPSSYITDGCNVNAGTMPNGPIQGFNLGMTAAHETGHWLGLLHTFEGYSCDGDGDFIDDTPMESVSTNGCPTSPVKDSCPNDPGPDPIHNFMDYSTDACYTTFTDGQIARIQNMWGAYRSGK